MKLKTLLIPAIVGAAACLSFTSDKKATAVYQFDTEVVMEMKEYMGETVQRTSDMKFYTSKSHSNLGYEMDIATHGQNMSASVIVDPKANTITTLMDQGGMKMAMQYDMSKMKEMAEKVTTEGDDPKAKTEITKTGRTKTIAGKKCEEYVVTQDRNYSLVWIAQDMKMPSFYDAFNQIQAAGKSADVEMPEGFPMEITSWPNGQGSSQMLSIQVTQINKNKEKTISTEGYSIMKLN